MPAALMEGAPPMPEHRNPPMMSSGIKPYAIMDLHNLDTSRDHLDWANDIDSHHAELRVPLLLDNVANFSSSAKLPRVWPWDHNETSRVTYPPISSSEMASVGSCEMLDVSNSCVFRGPMAKPGPNVVRPIAFKPISANNNVSPHSPRHPSGEDHVTTPHDLARPQAVKLGTGMLGHRTSPEKVVGRRPQHQMTKPMHHLSQESNNVPQHGPMGGFRAPNNFHHSTPANPQHNVNSNSYHNSSGYSHHSSHHNSSLNSHNASSYSHHNTSASSSRLSCAEDSFIGEFQRPSDRVDSVPAAVRGWHQAGEGMLQTPSPSDSGVGELEAILREKDAEINTLREVMDRNERAILQVYEERKNAWALDTQDLRDEYERKLKIQSRKSYKTEQVLSLQVYKLQQEQKTLSEEKEKVVCEKDAMKTQLGEAQCEASSLRSQLELKSQSGHESPRSNEELAMKNKEVINLHTQIHSYQADVEKKNKELGEKAKELIGCKEEVEKLKRELEKLKNPPVLCESSSQTHAPCEVSNLENVKPSMVGERERTIQSLQEDLMELKNQVLGMDDRHEKEKVQWLEEKNKVIRYQKQLQLNYVQMQRKNSVLEAEVQQLTLELENRDMKLIALSGEESVC